MKKQNNPTKTEKVTPNATRKLKLQKRKQKDQNLHGPRLLLIYDSSDCKIICVHNWKQMQRFI